MEARKIHVGGWAGCFEAYAGLRVPPTPRIFGHFGRRHDFVQDGGVRHGHESAVARKTRFYGFHSVRVCVTLWISILYDSYQGALLGRRGAGRPCGHPPGVSSDFLVIRGSRGSISCSARSAVRSQWQRNAPSSRRARHSSQSKLVLSRQPFSLRQRNSRMRPGRLPFLMPRLMR